MEDSGRVFHFLDVTEHTRVESLILWPSSLYFQVPAHLAVISLRTRHHGPHGGSDEDLALDIDHLHKQCCIPSLDEVSVDG